MTQTDSVEAREEDSASLGPLSPARAYFSPARSICTCLHALLIRYADVCSVPIPGPYDASCAPHQGSIPKTPSCTGSLVTGDVAWQRNACVGGIDGGS